MSESYDQRNSRQLICIHVSHNLSQSLGKSSIAEFNFILYTNEYMNPNECTDPLTSSRSSSQMSPLQCKSSHNAFKSVSNSNIVKPKGIIWNSKLNKTEKVFYPQHTKLLHFYSPPSQGSKVYTGTLVTLPYI